MNSAIPRDSHVLISCLFVRLSCGFCPCSGPDAQIQAVVDAGLLSSALAFLKPLYRKALLLVNRTVAARGRPALHCAAIAAVEEGAKVGAGGGSCAGHVTT
jgi:hypothetical protein